MFKGDMLDTCDYYLGILERAGIKPMGFDAAQVFYESTEKREVNPQGGAIVVNLGSDLAYCGWMLQEMRQMAYTGEQYQQEKFLRWLCFVQGVLKAAGLTTIPDIRSHIRFFVRR
jgi:hypothetical protein